jgi:hypothetical protein
MNLPMLIEQKGKIYPISGMSNKKIQFIQLTVKERRVDHFYLEVSVTEINQAPIVYHLYPVITPNQRQLDTAYFVAEANPANPIQVHDSSMVTVSIDSRPNCEEEDFELASVTYEISSLDE